MKLALRLTSIIAEKFNCIAIIFFIIVGLKIDFSWREPSHPFSDYHMVVWTLSASERGDRHQSLWKDYLLDELPACYPRNHDCGYILDNIVFPAHHQTGTPAEYVPNCIIYMPNTFFTAILLGPQPYFISNKSKYILLFILPCFPRIPDPNLLRNYTGIH